MTPAEVAAKLRAFNDWRRGGDVEYPGPLAVDEAIDAAVEMIDRLEEAESDALEQARLNGMGSEREAELLAKLEAAEKERDALRALVDILRSEISTLRAKITEMKQQEPVGWLLDGDFYEVRQMSLYKDNEPLPGQTALYALPGAQNVPSVPEVTDAMAIAFHAALTDGGIGQQEVEEIKTGLRAALAAAPEAKPCP